MKNKVSIILILIVVLNFTFNVGCQFSWWPTYKVHLWNGEEGFRAHWHIWINMTLIKIFALAAAGFFKRTEIDNNVTLSYSLFTFLGMLSYNYSGWPEPFNLFVTSFSLSAALLIFLTLWSRKN